MRDLIREKVAQAAGILRESGIDCWLTFVRESALARDPSLAYLLEGDVTWHTAVIIAADGSSVVIAGEYDRRSIEDIGVYGTVEGYVQGFREPLVRHLRRLDPRTIGVNYSTGSEVCDGLTHGMYLLLSGLLEEAALGGRLVSAERVISALRQRKSAEELARIRAAVDAAEEIFRRAHRFIAPGATEASVARFMHDETLKQGLDFAWDPRSCPSVFTGPDTAGAHYTPTERAVRRGHVLNIDFGVRKELYCSDLQRTMYVLEENESAPPPDVAHGFETIVRSIEAARRAMRPGVTGNSVDAAARGLILSAGYAEFPHALGHQVGRFAHDGTALLGPAWEKYATKPFEPLEEGMVFTIEPRLTVPGRGIVTIEEMVVVHAEGAEYLSEPQTTLWLIR